MGTIEPNETTNLPPLSTEFAGFQSPPPPGEDNLHGSENLQSIYHQIGSLCGPEMEDDEIVPPTRRAVERTFYLLEEIVNSLMASNSRFPEGFVTTDDRGGLRIEWWQQRTHCVTLVIDAKDESKDYVFKKLDDGKGTMNRPVVPQEIAEQLKIISQLQTDAGE